MSEVFISGTAGRAIVLRGDDIDVYTIDAEPRRHSMNDLSYLLSPLEQYDRVTLAADDAIVMALETAWTNDRALRLFEMLFDLDEELEIDLADALSELLSTPSTKEYLERQIYSLSAPSSLSALLGRSAIRERAILYVLLDGLAASQEGVERVRNSWDGLSPDLFRDNSVRCEFERRAISKGMFFNLARAFNREGGIDDILMQAYAEFHGLPNFRAIINSWTSNFRSQKSRRSIAKEIDEEAEKFSKPEFIEEDTTIHEKISNVRRQLDGILNQLRAGHLTLARKYAEELIQTQVRGGQEAYAVLSLCNIAQRAHEIGHNSLALEWLEGAASMEAADAWAHGQAGDAYLAVFRYSEAEHQFAVAEQMGDAHFGLTARARLLRARGELEAALVLFKKAMEEFGDQEKASLIWIHCAETLRELWRHEEAVSVYKSAISKFGELGPLLTGLAATLLDIGRVEEAAHLDRQVLRRDPDDAYAVIGYADALVHLNQIDDARATFQKGLERQPGNLRIACAQAGFLAGQFEFEAAIARFKELVAQNPGERAPRLGLAETYYEYKKYTNAITAYEEAVAVFSKDARLRNGLARALKKAGQLDKALQQYDRNAQEFPFDSSCLAGRASLLKELGHLKDAELAYDDVMAKRPNYLPASFGRASLYAIAGDFQKALSLLPDRVPRMKVEWVGLHIRAMTLLRMGQLEKAENIFSQALNDLPFRDHRIAFADGLALTKIRQHKFNDAVRYANLSRTDVSNVLLMHSKLLIGDRDGAARVYKASNDNPALGPAIRRLNDEIAVRFKLIDFGKAPADEWIMQQEEILILQAA